jgi:hypothetical protein
MHSRQVKVAVSYWRGTPLFINDYSKIVSTELVPTYAVRKSSDCIFCRDHLICRIVDQLKS